MSDTREKLIELICDGTLKTEICTTDTHLECETCKGDCGYCTILADHLIAYGVRLEASKQETHGDVIRAMSDEALGAYLCFVINAYHKVCDKCPASSLCSSEGIGLIKWLGLPADPENE